jgi:hypothetical protein
MKSDDELDGLIGLSGAREMAEQQLLKLLREQDSNAFTLMITFSDGRWAVTTEDLESGSSAAGQGDTFTEAWHLQDPQWPEST